MSTVTYDFNQPDGAATGWSSLGAIDLVVKTNYCSTDNNTGLYGGFRTHGLTIGNATAWQINFPTYAPLQTGNGGATVVLYNTTSNNGLGCFIGNAVHFKVYTGGVSSNITNDSRPGENPGGVGSLLDNIKMTHDTDGSIAIYRNGTLWSHAAAPADYANTSGSLPAVLISVQDTSSATTECWIDYLTIQDFIGDPTPITPPKLYVPTGASQQSKTW